MTSDEATAALIQIATPHLGRQMAALVVRKLLGARAVCDTCNGTQTVKRGELNPSTLPKVDCWPCDCFDGQGELLVLLALGGWIANDQPLHILSECPELNYNDPANPCYHGTVPLWRFPVADDPQ